ncbi:MAG: 4Fe-4S binding protein [Veillonellaceae bacterium]|nr:4Fe-4S binding protein [Veillonellaceae bacterium]
MIRLASCRFWRTIVPAAALAGTVWLLVKFSYPLPTYSEILLWYSRLDPWLLLAQLRAGAPAAWMALPLVLLALTLLFGRFFCGWLCPLGGLLAILHSLKVSVRSALGRKHTGAPPGWTNQLSAWRVPWLLFLLGVLLLGSAWPLYLSPFHLLTEELARVWHRQIPWVLLGVIGVGFLISPRFWCVYICPTGLLLSTVSSWRIFGARPPATCIHCGVCEKICPTAAADPENKRTAADCLLCGRCSESCPAGQFEISNRLLSAPSSPSPQTAFTRREVLRSGGALLLAGAATPLLARPTDANPLRPPGSREEDDFLSRCSRCGRCIKVCPSQCIQPMPITSGASLFLTPHIIPRQARCELCRQCQQVCPTGAIEQVPIPQVLMGRAVIDHSQCLGWAHGKLCLVCKEQCPQHAIDSDAQNRPSVQKEKCVGCGGCENACPVDPPAITVKPQSKRRHKKSPARI